jgi:hypothetical protein
MQHHVVIYFQKEKEKEVSSTHIKIMVYMNEVVLVYTCNLRDNCMQA